MIGLFAAIRNIRDTRGFGRIKYFLYSLSIQSVPVRVFISDGTDSEHFSDLQKFVEELDFDTSFVTLLHIPQEKFNKPELINTAANQSGCEWLIFSDIDYVFKRNAIEIGLREARKNRLVLCKVRMMPKNYTLNYDRINRWRMGRHKFNGGGETACGGFQFHHKSFFERSGGLDERMIGMCGMDESYVHRARMAGLQKVWIENHTDIMHQWHRPAKSFERPSSDMKRNWQLKDTIKHIDWRKEK